VNLPYGQPSPGWPVFGQVLLGKFFNSSYGPERGGATRDFVMEPGVHGGLGGDPAGPYGGPGRAVGQEGLGRRGGPVRVCEGLWSPLGGEGPRGVGRAQ
jgi:hypothetical protein